MYYRCLLPFTKDPPPVQCLNDRNNLTKSPGYVLSFTLSLNETPSQFFRNRTKMWHLKPLNNEIMVGVAEPPNRGLKLQVW